MSHQLPCDDEGGITLKCWTCGDEIELKQDNTYPLIKYAKCESCSKELDRLAGIEDNYQDIIRQYKLLRERIAMTEEFISKWRRNYNGA